MNFQGHEISTVARAYDVLGRCFLELDALGQICHANQTAQSVLQWPTPETWLHRPLSTMCEDLCLPLLANLSQPTDPPQTVQIGDSFRRWHVKPVVVDEQPHWFLIDEDVTEFEHIYNTLQSELRRVTGQISTERLSFDEYLKEIYGFLESVIINMPCYVFWKDLNFRYVFCNKKTVVDMTDSNKLSDIVGKTDYDFGWDPRTVDVCRQVDAHILSTGEARLNFEEVLVTKEGRVLNLLSNKMPLRNTRGEIIGILGATLDISDRKKLEQAKLQHSLGKEQQHLAETISEQENLYAKLETAITQFTGQRFPARLPAEEYLADLLYYFEKLFSLMPGYVFWKDKNFRYIMCNETASKYMLGFDRPDQIRGKTDYDFGWDPDLVATYRKIDEEILNTGLPMQVVEETVVTKEGQTIILLVNKSPLTNRAGEVVGIFGVSIDITAQKEAERLRLENQHQETVALEHQRFRKAADQLVHDVRSPLTSLQMTLKSCTGLPEKQRLTLRNATLRIQDMTSQLISQFPGAKQKSLGDEELASTPLLLSSVLLDILSEKRFEYQGQDINFSYDFPDNSWFVFIYIAQSDFKRMISNLINNAVEALSPTSRDVALMLDVEEHMIDITVHDSGVGMAPEIQKKILERQNFTQGKEGDHFGLGLTQVFDVLDRHEGKLRVISRVGYGTQMVLRFPAVSPPVWAATRIELNPNDLVIILDDEPTIHDAWNSHFVQKAPEMMLKHFTKAQDVIHYIQFLSPDERLKIFLLCDYELSPGDLTGLDVIERTTIYRALLVTSHYGNYSIQRKAVQAGVRILPKPLASEVPIKILKTKKNDPTQKHIVDVVLVDDDPDFARNVITTLDGFQVDYHESLENFFENLDLYPKDTKICLDRIFTFEKISGIDAAKKLHALGYTNLYLLTGFILEVGAIPPYLRVIEKHNLDAIYALRDDLE